MIFISAELLVKQFLKLTNHQYNAIVHWPESFTARLRRFKGSHGGNIITRYDFIQ